MNEKYYETHYPWDVSKELDLRWTSLQPAAERPATGDRSGWRATGSYSHFYYSHGNLYKTELCRLYEETGLCHFNTRCKFAHGTEELRVVFRHPRYRTKLCDNYHNTGFCPYGPRCYFIHQHKTGSQTNFSSNTTSFSSRGSGKTSFSSDFSSDQEDVSR